MEVGDRLRTLRLARSWSQAELARRAGAGQPNVQRIENGQTKSPRGDTLGNFARALGVSVDVLLGRTPIPDVLSPLPDAEPRAPYGAGDVLDIPLVAEGVGAGRPTLRVLPGAERPYHFRRDWLARKGWTEADPDRFGVYRLGTDEVALSMFPTIQPESALLVDLRADRNRVAPRSIWVVHADGGLVVKRVTAERELLVLESDNPDPEYAPQIVRATGAERGRILEGLVIWYATEVA